MLILLERRFYYIRNSNNLQQCLSHTSKWQNRFLIKHLKGNQRTLLTFPSSFGLISESLEPFGHQVSLLQTHSMVFLTIPLRIWNWQFRCVDAAMSVLHQNVIFYAYFSLSKKDKIDSWLSISRETDVGAHLLLKLKPLDSHMSLCTFWSFQCLCSE